MLSPALLQLYARCDSKEFPHKVLRSLELLFPGSIISIDEVFHTTGETVHHVDNRGFHSSMPETVKAFLVYSYQHPSIRYIMEGGKDQILYLTDFIPHAELRKLELYQQVFEPLGMRDEITFILPSSSSSHFGASVGLATKITAAQRRLAEELHPHLVQAKNNATLGPKAVLFDLEDKVLTSQMPIRGRSEIGECPLHVQALLDLFFDKNHTVPWQPPPELLLWIKQRRKLFDRGGSDWRELNPLVVTNGRGCLHINLSQVVDSDVEVLFFSGRLKKSPAPRDKGGMTPRERQVVSWVTEGKSNAEIATILSISVQTVKKHLEHIFRKLGVENRMALSVSILHSQTKNRNDR